MTVVCSYCNNLFKKCLLKNHSRKSDKIKEFYEKKNNKKMPKIIWENKKALNHKEPVYCLTKIKWSNDSQTTASGGAEGLIRLWDLASKKSFKTWKADNECVN